jgi:type IV pilus assembly protein PilA
MLKRIQMGFTLIELMLIVAIIGIMAAIALPAYQDFTIRTKVSELVLAASAYRTTVAEKAQQAGGVLASAGVGLTITPSGKVVSGSITDGGIITVVGNASTVGTTVTIVLTPTLGSDGKVVWTCSTDPNTFKFVPGECRN